MSLVTCSGYGAEYALDCMDKMLGIYGLNLLTSLELQVRPGQLQESTLANNRDKSIRAGQKPDDSRFRIIQGQGRLLLRRENSVSQKIYSKTSQRKKHQPV